MGQIWEEDPYVKNITFLDVLQKSNIYFEALFLVLMEIWS